MYTQKKYSWVKHIDFIIVDLICLIVAFTIAYRMKFENFYFIDSEAWRTFLFIICMLDVVITIVTCAYSGILRCKGYEILFRSLKLAAYSFASACVVFYLFKIGASYSREAMMVMYVIYFVISSMIKTLWKRLILGNWLSHTIRIHEHKLLVVAGKEKIDELIQNIQAGDFKQFEVKAIYLYDNDRGDESVIESVEGIPVLPADTNYVEYALDRYIDELFIESKYIQVDKVNIDRLIANGVGINVSIEGLFGVETDNQYIKRVGVYKTLSIGNFNFSNQQRVYLFFKRIFDLVFGFIGCVLLLPIMVFVKISYVATGDHASIFYTQKRVGKNGEVIKIYKFRSMVCDAEERLKELLKDESYRLEWERDQKFSNDPRITQAGRFLRRTSLDEMPQFINVVKGEMSLVGPRPLVEGELEQHNGLKLYQRVKPGITGWWACNGRSDIGYRERLELEYHYVKHCSLMLDLMCLFRTVACVFMKKGAV